MTVGIWGFGRVPGLVVFRGPSGTEADRDAERDDAVLLGGDRAVVDDVLEVSLGDELVRG